jgi:hypothetical protein
MLSVDERAFFASLFCMMALHLNSPGAVRKHHVGETPAEEGDFSKQP